MYDKKNEKNGILIPTELIVWCVWPSDSHFRLLKVVSFVELLKLFRMVCEMIAEKI